MTDSRAGAEKVQYEPRTSRGTRKYGSVQIGNVDIYCPYAHTNIQISQNLNEIKKVENIWSFF